MSHRYLAGVIEGFYGAPWSAEQRLALFGRLQNEGLNTYMYAPKDDLKHRARWRAPYEAEEWRALEALIGAAREHDLQFVYGIAPGLDMTYASAAEGEALRAKVAAVLDGGAHALALLFDDIPATLNETDARAFASFAEAHVRVANDLWAWMAHRWPEARLIICPTPYCEAMSGLVEDSPYLREVGHSLHEAIEVFWTGPDIISERIPKGSLEDLREVIGRDPMIWDNLHANDYDMRRFFMGPLDGRAPELRERTTGWLINPNCEYAVNHTAIATLGSYCRQGEVYDPERAYEAAVQGWLPAWETHGDPITEEELRFFTDSYYLPDRLGVSARAWIEGPGRERGNQLACSFARKVTELKDRHLMHTVYRHAWELKEAALLAEMASGRSGPLFSWEFRHPVMRRGVLSQFEEQLRMNRVGAYHWREQPAWGNAEGIRAATLEDEAAVNRVCLETGDDGADGTALYEDPDILGIIYAAPYLHLAPELAFVLEDEEGVCGYVLGALDSRAFYRAYTKEWLPRWRERYPRPSGPPGDWSPTERIVEKLYEPETFLPAEAETMPSHLHVDLLPRAQGKGHGTRLLLRLMRTMVEQGSTGVHLGVGCVNRRAIRFYRKIGFRELTRTDDCLYLGLPFR